MKNDTPLFVLCATDQNYVSYCGIMITSLFENNRDIDLYVYIITDSPLTLKSLHKFDKLASKYNQHIEFVSVDKSIFEDYPTKDMSYWTVAMYYRLLAAELLPQTINRVLYLDCDIIITGSLKAFLEIDMNDFAIGAVDDAFFNDKENNKRLQYPCSYSYFNSGVLLINLEYWRNHDIEKKCLDYLFSNYDKLSANDQDVLNAVLYDRTHFLPLTNNYQVLFKKDDIFHSYDKRMQNNIINTEPLIIHYAMQIKPWDIQYYKLPFAKTWQYYKRRSLWWYLPPTLPNQYRLKYLIKRYILWPLGIKINWHGKEFIS